jgi:hypothetical protein
MIGDKKKLKLGTFPYIGSPRSSKFSAHLKSYLSVEQMQGQYFYKQAFAIAILGS